MDDTRSEVGSLVVVFYGTEVRKRVDVSVGYCCIIKLAQPEVHSFAFMVISLW